MGTQWHIKNDGTWFMEFWFRDPNKTEINFKRGDKVISANPGYYTFETSHIQPILDDYIDMEEVKQLKITFKP
jgi:hypothetical protein